MKKIFYLASCLIGLSYWLAVSSLFAASVSPGLSKAKQEAESKGYLFITSKDEIIAKAKQERKLEVLTFLETDAKKAMISAFRKKYPFIQDVSAESIGGTEEYARFILEMKAGRAKRWDTVHISNQVYAEYPPYLKKFDVLGMAEQGVLNIPAPIVDPNNRNIVVQGLTGRCCCLQQKADLARQSAHDLGRLPQAGIQGPEIPCRCSPAFGSQSGACLGFGKNSRFREKNCRAETDLGARQSLAGIHGAGRVFSIHGFESLKCPGSESKGPFQEPGITNVGACAGQVR